MTKINKIVLTSICTLLSAFLLSCNTEVETREEYQARTYKTIEYDGCEYLEGWRTMAHKGNCKNPIHNCR